MNTNSINNILKNKNIKQEIVRLKYSIVNWLSKLEYAENNKDKTLTNIVPQFLPVETQKQMSNTNSHKQIAN